ncbi:Hypothetical protein PENO1_058780 [Penicillium occitanis (nom. inval.)]|nr:Hypothetical protein PENO1_058780 [Penicillium occitanis (nom. inval.)]PCH05646.1 hypothetical protein PENOC_027640 [Penicillium occitanis (nom. inval.)]
MATSITTFSGRRCTVIPRTQFFTAISTSAATETAGLPEVLSSFSTSTIQDTSSTSLTSTIAQPTDSNPASSITSLATTVVATSSTITAAAATLLPAITSSSIDPSSTQGSDDNTGDSSGNTSKKTVIAAAIGASLGAVAVVALVILCAYFRRRKRRTSTQFNDREKGAGTTGRFPGVAQLLDRLNPGPVAAFIPAIVDKVRPVFANLRSLPFISRNKNNDTFEQTQSGPTEKGLSLGRPIPQENSMQGASMSSAPRTTPESANPFADPPTGNVGTNRNNNIPENPFADPADPFSHTDYEDEISFSMPLTIRNGVADADDIDTNTNGVNNRDRHSARSTLSGSTLNIPNTRASSPLVHEFYSRPPTWKSLDRKSMKTEDRSSTYSDPFDLERPPTIHSSAHPTPMVERQRSQKGGYFPEMNFSFPRHVS